VQGQIRLSAFAGLDPAIERILDARLEAGHDE
jgi:hypothetical protein